MEGGGGPPDIGSGAGVMAPISVCVCRVSWFISACPTDPSAKALGSCLREAEMSLLSLFRLVGSQTVLLLTGCVS